MTLRLRFYFAMMVGTLFLVAPVVRAQGLRPADVDSPSFQQNWRGPNQNSAQSSVQTVPPVPSSPAGSSITMPKPSPGVPVTAQSGSLAKTLPASMLDQPANPAQIRLNGNQLSIEADNSSLSELIRKVAADTGMQVEGNTRDERVYGAYGPGTPAEVLTSLLYDSGYNIIMVGNEADGAPRRLVLSPRPAGASTQPMVASQNNEEEEDEAPTEYQPPPQPSAMQIPSPGLPPQARTPQQMLEELQHLRQGQLPPEPPQN